MSSIETLIGTLSEFRNIDYDDTSINFATSIGINDALIYFYDQNIHILNLDDFISKYPALIDECTLAVSCITKIGEFILSDNGTLKKPIVAFWKVKNILLSKYSDPEAPETWTWQTMVILPRNHMCTNGASLENNSELTFSSELSGNNHILQSIFKYLFRKEIKSKNGINSIGGYFPDATEFNLSMCRNSNESGLWCIHCIIMLISNGNNSFTEEIIDDLNISCKVKAVLQKFDIDLCTAFVPFKN